MPKCKTIEDAKLRFIQFYSRYDKTLYKALSKIEVNPQPEGHVYLSCTYKGVKYGQCYMIEN